MAKIFPMFSGSEGNATYIGADDFAVLIDVGVSYKRISESLYAANLSPDKIDAVLITHEHADHIKGLKTFLKHHSVPVIASRETIYALEYAKIINYESPRIYIDECDEYTIGSAQIKRFPTSHDCVGSSGYTVTLSDGVKLAVCTDLGIVTDEVRQALKGSRVVMLESNHDPVMLRLGPYPPELKIRISSEKGHLSNAVCAETVAYLYENGADRFILAHISEKNNTAEKASSAVRAALIDKGATENSDYILYVAEKEGSRVITI